MPGLRGEDDRGLVPMKGTWRVLASNKNRWKGYWREKGT